jgi:3-oxoacyl-[acyl-carrier protein] reductase
MSETAVVPPASVVLVNGGSRGLGLAMVTDLRARGVRVAAFARTVTDELRDLAAEAESELYAAPVDITDAGACRAFLRAAESRLGPIDGVVNNAAVGQDSLHAHTSPDDIARIIETNLTAPLVLTRQIVRRILAQGRQGRIVNITSVCAQRGYPGLVVYSATKGGMESATRALARELGGRVLANAVAPGFFA